MNHQFFIYDNRTLLLRGVNLSGNAKQPPNIPSHEPLGFFDHTNVSFINRPFPIHQADEHFSRLQNYGFNFLRFNITWEAIEHKAPGIYDNEYIDYVCKILLIAKKYGFRCFIDPHQDVWSRFTGGSGAPGWTLELAGFDITQFVHNNAAIVQNTFVHPKNFPKMIWATNYEKLACATMFTLFFAGRCFAPNKLVDGLNIQDYLQNHFLNAIRHLARAVVAAGLADSVVVGYDTLNEPSAGWIDCPDIRQVMKRQELRNGLTPSPLQAMMLGEAIPVDQVLVYEVGLLGPQKIDSITVDPIGERAWLPNHSCIWADHGVWSIEDQVALIPDYFAFHPTTKAPVDFLADFWKPFINRFTTSLREVHSHAIIFVEPPVYAFIPMFDQPNDAHGRLCYAPHFYDGLTLINKSFNTWFNIDFLGYLRGSYSSLAFALRFGLTGIKSAFKSQLQRLAQEGQNQLGDYPCIIGEIGIPFDMDNKRAYHTDDYSSQTLALDANMSALERNVLNFTLWNYCPDNSNEWGDNWNGEDLSIWSNPITPKIQKDLNHGSRALKAFVRPYPILTPGDPVWINFDLAKTTFETRIIQNQKPKNPTMEIFVPKIHFNKETSHVVISSGKYEWDDYKQIIYWKTEYSSKNSLQTIQIFGSPETDQDQSQEPEKNAVCPSCGIA